MEQKVLDELTELAKRCTGDCENCDIPCTGQIDYYARKTPEDVSTVRFCEPCCLDVIVNTLPQHSLFFPKWNETTDEYDTWYDISLKEIYEQVKAKYNEIDHCPLITVIYEDALYGKIYQCNNYKEGLWVEHGKTEGYA